jgi:nicotinamidase-related amidase
MYSAEQVLALARRAYKTGNASFDIKAADCVLLVIDMQDEFVKPGWTPYWVPEATRRIPIVRNLIETCRGLRVPVIFTAFAASHHYLDRPSSGRTMPNHFPDIEQDPSWFRDGVICADLAPARDEVVIRKPSYGAFYDTPLQTILKNLNRNTVVICGTLTNYCCGATARQAYERGLKAVVLSDATATDDMDLHEAELMVLRKGFARVMTTVDLIEELGRIDPRDATLGSS